MNILILHNVYQQRGGEDAVVAAEAALLRSAGHNVHVEFASNDSITDAWAKARVFVMTPHDPARVAWATKLTEKVKAQVVHVHNFFPLLTPAVYEGAGLAGAAVVQTLHNYRLLCANGQFLRDGKVCEKCLHGARGWAVVHRCYRGSTAGSMAVARMQWRAAREETWRRHVDRFIALTDFAREKFIAGGIPADRLIVKPNFIAPTAAAVSERAGALYVGRLSREKGVAVLIRAWRRLSGIPLLVVGDGPDRQALQEMAPTNVEFTGAVSASEVRDHMSKAALLVTPSLWYEGFPMTIVEAFAAGLPVAASRLGSLAEIVGHGENGALFIPGDEASLADTVQSLFARQGALAALGRGAYETYEAHYTPQANLQRIDAIYQDALETRANRAA